MKTFDVPDTIPLTKVRGFLSDLGLDDDNLIEMTVGVRGLHVELWAVDEQGRRYLAPDGKTKATHTISMRLDRDS